MDAGLGDDLLHPRNNVGSSRGHQAMVVTIVLTIISILTVAIRIYARVGLIKIMGREDWTILVSLVSLTLDIRR